MNKEVKEATLYCLLLKVYIATALAHLIPFLNLIIFYFVAISGPNKQD